MASNLVLITHRSPHHAQRSGSSPLADYLPDVHTIGEPNLIRQYRIKRLLSRMRTSPYGTKSVNKELLLLRYALGHKGGGVMHFLHGEHDFYYTGWFAPRLGYKTIATFHYPPEVLTDILPDTRFLGRLDAAIAVGSTQVDFLRQALKTDKVWCIPLGVDVDYFFPTSEDHRTNEYLFVGQHLRDFDLLSRVIRLLASREPSARIKCITRLDYQDFIPELSFVTRLSGISDEVLRENYQHSTCLLLPLKDVTACDAILEALACGLPIVTNDIGAVRDYVDETCAVLVPSGDAEAMAEACIALSNDRVLNRKMRVAARQRAMSLSWQNAAKRHLDVYAEISDESKR